MLVIVCVQLVVNYLAMRWVFGRAGWRSAPSSLYSRSSRLLLLPLRAACSHLPAAPANAFEGSYFPPGVFSAQRDSSAAHQLHRPQALLTHRLYSRGLREVATSSSEFITLEAKGNQQVISAQRSETMVNFPPAAVNANAFAAAFKGRFFFEAGQHRFVIAASRRVPPLCRQCSRHR